MFTSFTTVVKCVVRCSDIANLSLVLLHLVSKNHSKCLNLTQSTFFALISNRHSHDEIPIESIDVSPQINSLFMAHNWWINDESVLFAFVLPNF